MRLTRIDFEGRPGYYATAQRKKAHGQARVVVELLMPEYPKGRVCDADADDEEDLFVLAKWVQMNLDGARGTNSMIEDYYHELLRLGDF